MNDAEGAIYVPPKSGLPFLVVTFANGDMKTEQVNTRSEARALLARRTRRPSPASQIEGVAALASPLTQ